MGNFLTTRKFNFVKTLETGVSDHRKLISIMLRSTFTKRKSKKKFKFSINTPLCYLA